MTLVRTAVTALALLPVVLATACGGPATGPADPVDHAANLVQPGAVHTDPAADRAQTGRAVHAAQELYTFWNTGDPAYLDRAITPQFRDNTLPSGRPQGPAGPRAASAAFRAALPDLTCELADLYVTGDTFTARLVFRGHFTGVYQGIAGHGQAVDFPAIDLQHLDGSGVITEDWHLEDNLTFLQQAGLVTVAGAK
ncbi:ester cyclase [Amycolatopsis sp. PS_44_ISF1]|uniref:ester cyclase n=1 Tax=Amycolatopsis sp. PS_44_ISF1 TaxID=2974917 RepID=UPI0028E058C0|nr:ester cyclase [Amycolatopsis sp. PS_44_ISF1]MDT8913059.1 ester cyclase [Amycolatopsis sp. PS_44_ISF1]